MLHEPELLAPAGNEAALRAAVSAGADAVYLGLESFNARRGADNFSFESFSAACDYAHLRGVKVYVALNVAILPSEIDEALECARQAYRAGADAFIVQDIGLAAELGRTLPEARLHISTQMNTHNVAGIEAAHRLGAQRVTLARELSLEEIAHVAREAEGRGMEVEAFAHGALCVCYSGQCFMSSLIGGRSANRGMCAQACRLPYELHNKALRKNLPSPGDHLLSPQDLCAIDLIPQLLEVGVASFKIEGRMKSPEYVAAVTGVYRAVLDRALAERTAQATEEEHRVLAEAFSRGFTTAYLVGERGNDIMSYGRPNNRGVFVGRVSSVKNGVASIAVERELHDGDVLEFWTNRGHFAHTVSGLAEGKNGEACVRPERAVGKGDRVFRVRNAEATFQDDVAEPRIPVVGRVSARRGEPLSVSFVLADGRVKRRYEAQGRDASAMGYAEGPVVEAARTKPLDIDDVRAHIDRLGQTPFSLVELDVSLDEGVGMGFSQLHHVRSAALDDLQAQMIAPFESRALPRVKAREPLSIARPRGCKVVAWATNPACARAAKRAGADLIYVPALAYRRGEAVIAGQRSETAEQAGYPKQAVVAMPTIDHDMIEGTRETMRDIDAWRYAKTGKPLYVDNLGDAVRAIDEGCTVDLGSHVPVTNRLSLELAAQWGIERVWLSPELNLAQIADLAKDAPVEVGLTIIGAQELMVTEHCLLMSQGPCDENCDACPRRKSPHYLKDRKGYEFPVITDALGRSHLYNAVTLDVAHAMPDIIHAGVTSLMVDTTMMNVEETTLAVARVVRARNVALSDGNTLAKTPDTTSGHLFRGVS